MAPIQKEIARSIQQGTGTFLNHAHKCLETILEINKNTSVSGADTMTMERS